VAKPSSDVRYVMTASLTVRTWLGEKVTLEGEEQLSLARVQAVGDAAGPAEPNSFSGEP
jgi:hypothetical protein